MDTNEQNGFSFAWPWVGMLKVERGRITSGSPDALENERWNLMNIRDEEIREVSSLLSSAVARSMGVFWLDARLLGIG
ncbi:hypothetical protein [Pelagicoccus albus]|uniref:hypothetical protein n=1 Tax=Pelagicoccus albus TaxID=415222 RepID=UPI0030DA77A6